MFERFFPVMIATKGMEIEFDKHDDRKVYCHLDEGCGHDLLASLMKEARKVEGSRGELEIQMQDFKVFFKLW